MKQFLITAAGVFAGLMLFLVGIPVLLIGMAASSSGGEVAPDQTVLNLDLRQNLTDQDSGNPLSALGGGSLSVMSIISTLRHAETDDRVKALLIRLPEGGWSLRRLMKSAAQSSISRLPESLSWRTARGSIHPEW